MVTHLLKFFLVRATEVKSVAFFFTLFCIIGIGMTIGRSTAGALFFKRFGIEYLPLMYVAIGIVMMVVSMVYAAFSDRFPPARFLKILLGISIGLLLFNWLVITTFQWEFAYPFYFLSFELISELILVHGALYISAHFDTLQSKRIVPLILAGGQFGSIIGGLLLMSAVPVFGVDNMLVFWSLLLLLSIVLVQWFHVKSGVSPLYCYPRKSSRPIRSAIGSVKQGIKFMGFSELLRFMSIALFLMVICFYVLNYSVNRVYVAHFETEEQLTVFFGMLEAVFSVSTLILQLFFINRLMRKIGIRKSNLVFPVFTIASFVGLLYSFTLPFALFASMTGEVVKNAVRNPVRSLFFNALPNYMQGRARAMSVAIVMPLALVVTGGLLVLAQNFDQTYYILGFGLLVSIVYYYFSVCMSRVYGQSLISVLQEKISLPSIFSDSTEIATDHRLIRELRDGIDHDDDEISIACVKVLLSIDPHQVDEAVNARLNEANSSYYDKVIRLIIDHDDPWQEQILKRALETGDNHLKASALYALISRKSDGLRERVVSFLEDSNPRLKVVGVFGVLELEYSDLIPASLELWHSLLLSENENDNLAALALLSKHPCLDFQDDLRRLLESSNKRVLNCALDALQQWPEKKFPDLIGTLLDLFCNQDPGIREKALKCGHLLERPDRLVIAVEGLDDSLEKVRDAAAELLFFGLADPVPQLSGWLLNSEVSIRAQIALLGILLKRKPKDELLQRIAVVKAKESAELWQAITALQRHCELPCEAASLELLTHVLNEHLNLLVDLALTCWEHANHFHSIAIIRAAIQSGESQHVTNAIEALMSLNKDDFVQIMCSVLEGRINSDDALGVVEYPGIKLDSLNKVLLWCKQRQDIWLSLCAADAMKTCADQAGAA